MLGKCRHQQNSSIWSVCLWKKWKIDAKFSIEYKDDKKLCHQAGTNKQAFKQAKYMSFEIKNNELLEYLWNYNTNRNNM